MSDLLARKKLPHPRNGLFSESGPEESTRETDSSVLVCNAGKAPWLTCHAVAVRIRPDTEGQVLCNLSSAVQMFIVIIIYYTSIMTELP